MAPVCVALLVSVAASSILGTSWARNGPRPGSRNPPYYIEVYPEIELNGNLTNHIFFALVQSFGAEFNGSGNIAGVKVAVDRINNDSSMLPSHVLHYTLTDSQVRNKTRCVMTIPPPTITTHLSTNFFTV